MSKGWSTCGYGLGGGGVVVAVAMAEVMVVGPTMRCSRRANINNRQMRQLASPTARGDSARLAPRRCRGKARARATGGVGRRSRWVAQAREGAAGGPMDGGPVATAALVGSSNGRPTWEGAFRRRQARLHPARASNRPQAQHSVARQRPHVRSCNAPAGLTANFFSPGSPAGILSRPPAPRYARSLRHISSRLDFTPSSRPSPAQLRPAPRLPMPLEPGRPSILAFPPAGPGASVCVSVCDEADETPRPLLPA